MPGTDRRHVPATGGRARIYRHSSFSARAGSGGGCQGQVRLHALAEAARKGHTGLVKLLIESRRH